MNKFFSNTRVHTFRLVVPDMVRRANRHQWKWAVFRLNDELGVCYLYPFPTSKYPEDAERQYILTNHGQKKEWTLSDDQFNALPSTHWSEPVLLHNDMLVVSAKNSMHCCPESLRLWSLRVHCFSTMIWKYILSLYVLCHFEQILIFWICWFWFWRQTQSTKGQKGWDRRRQQIDQDLESRKWIKILWPHSNETTTSTGSAMRYFYRPLNPQHLPSPDTASSLHRTVSSVCDRRHRLRCSFSSNHRFIASYAIHRALGTFWRTQSLFSTVSHPASTSVHWCTI